MDVRLDNLGIICMQLHWCYVGRTMQSAHREHARISVEGCTHMRIMPAFTHLL